MSRLPVATLFRADRIVRAGLLLLAGYQFVLALWLAVAPHSFFVTLGPFGAQNDHYMRDTATFSAAFGVALLIAYRNPGWRTPVLTTVAIQFALHTINHLVDVDRAHPSWIGPLDFAGLGLATAMLIWLVLQSHRQDSLPTAI